MSLEEDAKMPNTNTTKMAKICVSMIKEKLSLFEVMQQDMAHANL